MSATVQSGGLPEGSGAESRRVSAARVRAAARLSGHRRALRPLALAVIAAVAVIALAGHPAPSLRGSGLGVTLALVSFGVAVGAASRGVGPQLPAILAMGAAGIALAALQPRDATTLAGGAAVWFALVRLPLRIGAIAGLALTAGLDLAAGFAGSSAQSVLATTLLCALLGVVAVFLRQARESQARTELLLAALQDAQEEQARAAAVAERGRIAGELHDVLAHSLSGAAIQLEGARLLSEREATTPPIREALERAARLVREGLLQAREAVGALRGDRLPGTEELGSLVAHATQDLRLDARLKVQGDPRPLDPHGALALYRGAQEALTNAARYAPGSRVELVLRYASAHVTLSVENGAATAQELTGLGGGHGLASVRERIERLGGTMTAGATLAGWRVELDLPA